MALVFEPGRPPIRRKQSLRRRAAETAAFTNVLTSGGVRTVRLLARNPNRNAYAESFVRSIKSECLSKVIALSETHLRRFSLTAWSGPNFSNH